LVCSIGTSVIYNITSVIYNAILVGFSGHVVISS